MPIVAAFAASHAYTFQSNAGLEPTGGSGEELLELVKRDIPRFRKLIAEIGIQPE